MAKLFSLSTDVKTIAQNAIDDLIDQLGKDCLLQFPPIQEYCVNCIIVGVQFLNATWYLSSW